MRFSAFLVVWAALRGARGQDGDVQVLEPRNFKDLGAKRVKILYEPMLVPGMMDETTGGMADFDVVDAPMPCHDCLITGFLPSLQFEDGTVANANTSMSLHHAVFANLNRTDTTCPDWEGERFLAAGNERTALDLTLGGTRKAGYYVGRHDVGAVVMELMNEAMDPRTVRLSVEWEFLGSGVADGFDVAVPLWLDVTGPCGSSSVDVSGEGDVFDVTMSPPWASPFGGDLLVMNGHLHDGGVRLDVFVNGRRACESVARYGESEGFVVPPSGSSMDSGMHNHQGGGGGEADMVRISSISACHNLGRVEPGVELGITAFYNFTEHPGMQDRQGGLEPVMGIELVHIARPWQEAVQDYLAGQMAS
ncbi:hypothetical protein VTK73DRAFT_1306 [Phialemonium thermophilum]|uniref:Uncharacterized protein n=1 Tax=Phialemonium thermophilum TaxID=223376 RepID=A0ABR3VTU0_9PEZI